MKNHFYIVAFLIAVLIGACGKEEETGLGGLSVQTTSPSFVIPSSITPICGSFLFSITKSYFAISQIRMQWTDVNRDLTILRVRVEASSGNLSNNQGTYVKDLTGDQIRSLFVYEDNDGNQANISNGFVPAPTSADTPRVIRLREGCVANFGQLTLTSEDQGFKARANLEVLSTASLNEAGVAAGEGDAGQERLVRARTGFQLIYEN